MKYLYLYLLFLHIFLFFITSCEPYREPKRMLINSLPIGIIVEKDCDCDNTRIYKITINNNGYITKVDNVNKFIYKQLIEGDTIYHSQ